MIALDLGQVADITGGRLVDGHEPVTVRGAVADSRDVTTGDLFVAIPGERVDGHDFARQAMAAGAAGVLAEREVPAPAVVVPDSVVALGRLAAHVRRHLPDVKVVAVTGSTGKTTVKDLLARICALRGPVVAPTGSFNTEVGLPLTVLKADETTRTMVLEMGSRGPGHIAYLCDIADPDVAVVLNIGTAHLGEFGDRAATAGAKAEIVRSLDATGTAVLNRDDPLVSRMRDATVARVLTFGQDPESDVCASDVRLDDSARADFKLTYQRATAEVRLRLAGEHNVSNAAAAAAAGLALGLSLPDVADALTAAEPVGKFRMQIQHAPGGVTVINDAYNANPESMAAGLKALAEMGRRRGARCWAVLGEMRELGPETRSAHEAIGRLVVDLGVSRLIAVGEGARPIQAGASLEGLPSGESEWVPDVESAVRHLRDSLCPGDLVLVKASRAVGLERVAEALVGACDPSGVGGSR